MLHDPDDLILQIRSPEIRKYADESVRALRAGALRAAVLSLWVAVNTDIIGKIRELAASGDNQADEEIKQLETWIQTTDIRKLQNFEENILTLARDKFEFLTSIETEELERLRQDRHRCAHPALTPDGSLYDPTPEQIRAHLVVATRALFAHPPVQGRSALNRFKAEVISQTFPLQSAQVSAYLGPKYLDRGKDILIRDIVKLYLQQMLAETPDVPRERSLHVLRAVRDRRFPLYQQVMADKWGTRVSTAGDKELPFVIELLDFDSDLWSLLPEYEKSRLNNYLEQLPSSQAEILLKAFQLPLFHNVAHTRLVNMPTKDLIAILMSQDHLPHDLAVLAVKHLETVDTYKAAGQLLEIIN